MCFHIPSFIGDSRNCAATRMKQLPIFFRVIGSAGEAAGHTNNGNWLAVGGLQSGVFCFESADFT
jgi:hypothetical protein